MAAASVERYGLSRIISPSFVIFVMFVLMFNRNRGGMFAAGNDGCDKKIINTFDQGTGTDFLCDELAGPGNILRGDFTEYLKGTVSISTDNAKNGCNINSL